MPHPFMYIVYQFCLSKPNILTITPSVLAPRYVNVILNNTLILGRNLCSIRYLCSFSLLLLVNSYFGTYFDRLYLQSSSRLGIIISSCTKLWPSTNFKLWYMKSKSKVKNSDKIQRKLFPYNNYFTLPIILLIVLPMIRILAQSFYLKSH